MRQTLCLVAGLMGSLFAQQPERNPDNLRQGLQSKDAIEVIWAAHYARLLGDRALVTPLQDTLRAWLPDDDEAAAIVRLYVLDALYGLEAKMPASDLVPLLDTNVETVAFALLAREPKLNEHELLELLRRDWPQLLTERSNPVLATERELRALATANLLASQNTPGLASLLAKDLDLDLHVVVGSQPARPAGPIWRNIGLLQAADADRDPALPPMPEYELAIARGDMPRSRLLAPGTINILVRRTETRATNQAELTTVSIMLPETLAPTAVDGLTWLRKLAGGVPAPRRRLEIELSDPERYLETVVGKRDELQAFVDRLREQLLTRGAVTPSEAKRLERKVKVVVHDQRADKTKRLPDIPARD